MRRRHFLSAFASIGAGIAVGGIQPSTLSALQAPDFRRFRPRLIDEPDPNGLFDLIREFSTDAVTRRHTLGNGAHGVNASPETVEAFGVPEGRGRDFFEWHRGYLRELEDFLAARSRRLPTWAPWEAIPPRFQGLNAPAGYVTQPEPNAMRAVFRPFRNDLLPFYADVDAFGVALSWTAHFSVHAACGGRMAHVDKAATAPIFWPWHGFVDDLYTAWLDARAKSIGWVPRPPADWPWGRTPRRARGTPPETPARPNPKVPWCIGLTRDEARGRIEALGLAVRFVALDRGGHRVKRQDPLPFVEVAPGSRVTIYRWPA